MRHLFRTFLAVLLTVATVGTLRDPQFWLTGDQRGDLLMHRRHFADAARAYHDLWRRGVAQFRDGQFEASAKTFAGVPGEIGLYNSGNAWLMHGQYERAISCYDKALQLRPGWKNALDNKAVAVARLGALQLAGKDRKEESADAYDADDIAFDAKNANDGKVREPMSVELSNEALQAAWLRRVKATPAQFLKTKFAWQAQNTPKP